MQFPEGLENTPFIWNHGVPLTTFYYYIQGRNPTFAKGNGSKFERSIFQIFWRLHCCAKFLSFELETSNFGYLLIFSLCWTVPSLRKIGQHLYYTFYKGPPFEFWVNYKNKKHQSGDPCKMCNINVVLSSSNLAQFSKMKK